MTPVWIFDDGGRAAAGYKGKSGDCVARAIAIATQYPYEDVCKLVENIATTERPKAAKRRRGRSDSQTGVYIPTTRRLMASLGWVWTPTMFVGQGCKVHLKADELPKGRLVVSVSRHLVAVIDGVIRDTYDCSRDGTRCVYGYWKAA